MTSGGVLGGATALFVAGAIAAFSGCGLATSGLEGDGRGKPCTVSAECDDANPCTIDECVAEGVCQATSVPDGVAPAQVSGDCATASCAGGVVTRAAEPGDLPNDANACTADSCQGTTAVLTPLPGQACTVGTARGFCTEAGACGVTCTDGGPPCDDGNPCTTDACNEAVERCEFVLLDGGPVPGALQVAGDCRVSRCVAGVATSDPDDTDLPADGEPCTADLCNRGTASHPDLPAGTPCGAMTVCDGMGTCTGCVQATDCPAGDECKAPTCEAGACAWTYAGAGTEVQVVSGDCARTYCDGLGGTYALGDPSDSEPPLTTCAGKECGFTANNCQVLVDCGSCSLPDTCGGGGVDDACGCSAASPCTPGLCGSHPDACGVMVSCDICAGTNPDCDGTSCWCEAAGAVCGEGESCTPSGCTCGSLTVTAAAACGGGSCVGPAGAKTCDCDGAGPKGSCGQGEGCYLGYCACGPDVGYATPQACPNADEYRLCQPGVGCACEAGTCNNGFVCAGGECTCDGNADCDAGGMCSGGVCSCGGASCGFGQVCLAGACVCAGGSCQGP